MAKIGRNTACPCSSGKKFKQCCLTRVQSSSSSSRQQGPGAVAIAHEWLSEHYGDLLSTTAPQDFFDATDSEIREQMAQIPKSFYGMLEINFNEWLLADATIPVNGEEVRTIDLILGPRGPKLTPHNRHQLEALKAAPLLLYEIQEVQKGKGVVVADLLNDQVPPFFVHEVRATESLVPWDIIGSRCTLESDGSYRFGGAAYPLPRDEADLCLAHIKKQLRTKHGKANPHAVCSQAIITWWLDYISAPPKLPIFVDHQTKDLIFFTTDHYNVSDWQKLNTILLAQKNVKVEKEESIWMLIEAINAKRFRTLARLERSAKSNKLRVECNTKGKADSARIWIETIAGHLLRHTSRRSSSPAQVLRQEAKKKPSPPVKQEEIPKDIQQQIIHEYLVRHYEEWPTLPLPALNGKTPLEAAKLTSLRPKLVNILKQIEQGGARQAKQDGIPAFDISFLWKRLGIEKS